LIIKYDHISVKKQLCGLIF